LLQITNNSLLNLVIQYSLEPSNLIIISSTPFPIPRNLLPGQGTYPDIPDGDSGANSGGNANPHAGGLVLQQLIDALKGVSTKTKVSSDELGYFYPN
jgi:hypothetical protein